MRWTRARRVELSAVVSTLFVVGILVNLPAPAHAAPASSQPAASTPYVVTWNGVDVTTAGSASSALSVNLNQAANLWYNWSTGTLAPVDISDARLQMYYLGFAVSTRDQVLTNPTAQPSGAISLSWTPVSVAYLLEGVYRLTASFLAPNGTTMFSENFYVRGTAPLGIVAILPIVLLILVIYEVYGLARSGRYAAIGRKMEKEPPATPPPSTESGSPPATSGESPPANSSDASPADEATPPSSGGNP